MFHNPEEWQTLVSKPIPSEKPREKTQLSSQSKTKGSVQSSFSHLKYLLWEPQAATEVSSRQLSFSPSYFPASGSLLEPTCDLCAATGHVASRARSSREHTSQQFARWVRALPFLPMPATILPSLMCVPASLLVPPPIRYQKRVGGLFPLSNDLPSLTSVQCHTSFCHRLAWGKGIYSQEQNIPQRGPALARQELLPGHHRYRLLGCFMISSSSPSCSPPAPRGPARLLVSPVNSNVKFKKNCQ